MIAIAQILDPASYSFNLYIIPLIITVLAIIALGVLVLSREKLSLVSGSLLLTIGAVIIWLVTYVMAFMANTAEVGMWWVQLGYLGIPFLAPGTYMFTLAVLGKFRGAYRLRSWLLWMAGVLFAIAGTTTDILIADVRHFYWGWYGQYGWLGTLFITFTVGTIVASVFLFYEEYQAAPPGVRKRRMSVLMLAFAISAIGAVDFLGVYGIPAYPFGYLGILGFIALASRAVWSYHLRDITPALAANQIIETMFDGVLVLDVEGQVQVANPAACDMLSLTGNDVMGRQASALLSGFVFEDLLERLMQGQGVRNYGISYQPPRSSEPRYLNMAVSAMRESDGEPVAVVCVLRDVTEHKKTEQEIRRLNEELESRVMRRTAQLQAANFELETEIAERVKIEKERAALFDREQQARAEAEAAVRAREQLLYIVSHDLRNPLSVVKVGTTLIKKRFAREVVRPDDMILRGLNQIETAGSRMNMLINELLDFARLQVGQPIDIRTRPTDLVDMARRVVGQYEHLQNRHEITVVTELDSFVGLWDAERLERVLENLVANAVKYSPMGGRIEVRVCKQEVDEQGCAVITVHDEGMGIPAADLPYIFDWFHRGSNTEGHIAGTGIGLPSAKQAVEAQGGTIAAESDEGLGSTFTVTLPWAPLGLRAESSLASAERQAKGVQHQ